MIPLARYRSAAAGRVRSWGRAGKIALALPYRRALGRVRFVAVTGSCGKTTTVELATAVLSARGSARKGTGLTNPPHRVAGTILTTTPWVRFSVNELGGFEPGALARSCRVLRPDIGVVTAVRFDHLKAFRDLDATAREKSTLVEALPAEGTAVLNADDERVLAMGELTGARVITFGLSDGAAVRGEDVRASWPEPLSLAVTYGGRRARVETQLLGAHWATAVLAALATGVAAGVPIEDGARAIAAVPPVLGRMSQHAAGGVTFVQDTWKAPLYSIPLVLEFLRGARASRKILVVGSVSDYRGGNAKMWRDLARDAAVVVDKLVLVGRWAHHGLRGRTRPDDDRVVAFDNLYEANRFLRGYLEPGDLVLLKGSNRNDHLDRLILDRTSGIACWRVDCRRWTRCGDCGLRNSPFVPEPA